MTPSIGLSRRLSNPDGSFAGIVLLAVNIAYFHDLFAGLTLGPHGSMSLIGRDGAMLMRQPYDPKVIGRNISAATFRRFMSAPEGSFSEKASIDGIRRLYWFANFPHAPLIIMAAASEQDFYAAWRRRALTIGLLMAAFGAAFVGLSVLLGVQLRRRMRAESELQLLASTDGLTGLNNRRSLGEILELEWRRAKRSQSVCRCCSSISIDSRPTTTPTAIRPVTIPWRPSPAALPTTSGVRPTALRAMEERSSLSCFPIPRRTALR